MIIKSIKVPKWIPPIIEKHKIIIPSNLHGNWIINNISGSKNQGNKAVDMIEDIIPKIAKNYKNFYIFQEYVF